MSVTAVFVCKNRRYLRVVLRLGNFLELRPVDQARRVPQGVPFLFLFSTRS